MIEIFNLLFVFTGKITNQSLVIMGTLFFRISVRSSDFSLVGKNFSSRGFSFLRLKKSSRIQIGDNCTLNNGERFNSIGRQLRCIITVREEGELIIGNNVGISSSAIFCNKRIVIGNNVKVGGNVCIYDTDFHALNFVSRRSKNTDVEETLSKEVKIGNDVFIGAHSVILKGVVIGDRAIIGACSVVTKNVPADEVWAGNPARCIRSDSLQNISHEYL